MRKLFIILLSIFVVSCTKEKITEDPTSTNEVTNSKVTSNTVSGINSFSSLNPPTASQIDYEVKLIIYYITGIDASYITPSLKLIEDLSFDDNDFYELYQQIYTRFDLYVSIMDKETLKTVQDLVDYVKKYTEIKKKSYSKSDSIRLQQVKSYLPMNLGDALPSAVSINYNCEVNYKKISDFQEAIVSFSRIQSHLPSVIETRNIIQAANTNSNKTEVYDYSIDYLAPYQPDILTMSTSSSGMCTWNYGRLRINIYRGFKCESFQNAHLEASFDVILSRNTLFHTDFLYFPTEYGIQIMSVTNLNVSNVTPPCYIPTPGNGGNTGGGNTGGGTNPPLTEQQIHTKVLEVVLDHLYNYNGPALTDQTRFIEDLNFDSLDIIEVGMKIQRELNFQFDISWDNYHNFLTIGAFCNYIFQNHT